MTSAVRRRRVATRLVLAATTTTVLALAACGGSDGGSATGPAGDPVTGGTGHIVEQSEPRSLDPAVIMNSWANSPLLGNSLYGTLMTDRPDGTVDYHIASDFQTDDGGKTFTLKLRDGVAFSDGTPLDAAAVKFAWDRIKDPATGSPDIPQASMIDHTDVVDPTTLEVTLVSPVPNFANAVLQTSMNWVASPAALKAGTQAFDAHPVGAGPYVLDSWSRQDVIALDRNDGYYTQRPYLDRLEIRAIGDEDQRYNTVAAGQADLELDSSWTKSPRPRQPVCRPPHSRSAAASPCR